MSNEYVTFRGPIFDERGTTIVHHFQEEVVHETGLTAKQQISALQDQTFVTKTGAYEGSIQLVGVPGHETITDGGMVYGPWLEGVGSRNQTTRFKGYHIMRTITQTANRVIAKSVIAQLLPKYVAELNE